MKNKDRKKAIIKETKALFWTVSPFECGWNSNGLGCKTQCIDCKLKSEKK